ncbi:hypothetical protein B0T13DRAFT_447888 [Neurospora crassa]|nr:hypothetical protein B0T13DRAFT_452600 [Neurospora crassa]KAK3498106.1 hypothetical protein B0T13DRAFT_447888 [Neurospora crassa]
MGLTSDYIRSAKTALRYFPYTFSDTGAMLDPQLKQCPVYIKYNGLCRTSIAAISGIGHVRPPSLLAFKGEIEYKKKRKRKREREREKEKEGEVKGIFNQEQYYLNFSKVYIFNINSLLPALIVKSSKINIF